MKPSIPTLPPVFEELNWGSHLPALMACTAICEGSVLEIGCGNFSTPCLHALCSALGLPLVTTELEDGWREKFMDFASDSHRILKQSDALLRELSSQSWGLVLVDDQADTRLDRLNMFFDVSRFVLFHDCNFTEYKQALADWVSQHECHHSIYTRCGPHTLIVSKTHPIPVLQ